MPDHDCIPTVEADILPFARNLENSTGHRGLWPNVSSLLISG